MRKGGAAPVTMGLSENDYQILYDLGFDEGDLEMIEHYHPNITLNRIRDEYRRVESERNRQANSSITDRDIALETMHNLTSETQEEYVGGRRKKTIKKSRTNKSKKSRTKKSKKSRTKKSRR
jgi:hypothetical protein